ncbi:MAG: DNA repair and recombination protein RadA [Candidatus Bathyarchaeia archaeon]
MTVSVECLEVDDIQGVGPETAKKLLRAGFSTVQSIAVTSARELSEKTNLTHETTLSITENARATLGQDVMRAIDLYRHRSEALTLRTGATAFDELLGGGFESQAVTELVGEFAAGKSQICMKLSAMVQQPATHGGLGGRAFFLDTEGTFNPKRVYDIATNIGLNAEETLANILYARAYNSDHQMFLVDRLPDIIQRENIKLIIVDSIISHFRSEYLGREHLNERQQKLNQHVHKILRIAEIFNLPAVVTNQIQANPQNFGYGDPNRPAGGNVLAHSTTHRVWLRKKSPGRVARIVDSPNLPPGEAFFQITAKGIEDIDEKLRTKLSKSESSNNVNE